MTVLAVALAALAVLTASGRPGRRSAATRLAVVRPAVSSPSGRPAVVGGRRTASGLLRTPRAAALALGVALWLLVGGVTGLALGVGAVVGLPRWLGRLEPSRVRRRRSQLAQDLPVAADLLAACLTAGSAPADALEAVAAALGGPVEEVLGSVAVALRLGADPVSAWAPFRDEPEVAPLARAVSRAVHGGTPLAAAVARCGAELRSRRQAAADAASEAVGVKTAGPLGLCFLPAFVLVGVAPTVVGLAGTLLG